ncbi:Putative ribonuclease H protein At1g65750 [Linum grandiflorum]
MGGSPSYIWRSVRSTQNMIRRGLRWRLGDEASVKVFGDPWLREEENSWVETPAPVGMEDIKVHELLLPGIAEWDEELLEEIFDARDVACIRMMAPPMGREVGRVIWNYSRNGRYVVCSAYRLCMDVLVEDSHLPKQCDWTTLWKLEIPNRLRHFLWRIARHVLPTRTALALRYVPISTECGLCATREETPWHIFLECLVATRCWDLVGVRSRIEEVARRVASIEEWLFEIIKRFSSKDMSDIVAVLWGLWSERNGRIWQQISRPEEIIVQISRDQIRDWVKAQVVVGPNGMPRPKSVCKKWHRPPVGAVKINVDAAFFEDSASFGVGLVLRGRVGQLMGYR